MRDRLYKIGVLVHDSDMIDQYHRLGKLFNCEVIIQFASNTQNCIKEAIRMEQVDGVKAIIAHSKHVEVLRARVQVPLVALPLSEFAFACALTRAKRYGTRIAFVDFSTDESLSDRRDYEEIARLLACPPAKRYLCPDVMLVDQALDDVERDGFDVVIGGSTQFKRAVERRGMPHEFIHTRDSSIIWALSQAIGSAAAFESASQQVGWLNSFLAAFPSGIIAVQNEGAEEWRVGAINDKAVQMTGIERRFSIGQPVGAVRLQYPFLEAVLSVPPGQSNEVLLNGKQYIVVCSQIAGRMGEILGRLYQLQTADEIKNSELQLRRSVVRSGFEAKTTFRDIVGQSAAIQEAVDKGTRFAGTTSNIIITGESGSGKEMFAQSIHNASPYSSGPFLAVNCATLPESLLEAELFGYEAGTFTGANKKGKPGLLELVHRGTLFLDEVAEMPLALQAKLLRVLQERSFRRIGGSQSIIVDIRIISATHKDLEQEMRAGRFRADLMYRLNVLPLYIPALRERREDIPLLIQYFSQILSAKLGKAFYLTRACIEEMERYPWPGNVRELMNFMERLIVLSTDGTISRDYLHSLLTERAAPGPRSPEFLACAQDTLTIPVGTMQEMERSILAQLDSRFGGDKKKLAAVTQISATTLWRRSKQSASEGGEGHS